MKQYSILILVAALANVSYAQDNERLIDTKTYVRDGKTITEKTFKKDSLGTYVPPKNVKQLSGESLKALQKKCDEARQKAKSDPSVKSFQYGEYSYDLNCKLLGKYVPPKESLRKEIIEVTTTTTTTTTTVPKPQVNFGGNEKEMREISMTSNGRRSVLKVSKADYDAFIATKDKKKKDLFLELAKKYKK